MYLLVINQLVTMLIIGISGFIFAKAFKIEESQQKFLSKLLLYFINPCVIINSFNKEFDAGKMQNLLIVMGLALVAHLVMIFLSRVSTKDQIERLGIIFTNCGFVGIPLIRGVFGDEGVFFLMGYLVVFNLLLWTWGYRQLSGESNIKKILTNPNIISVVIGMILYCMPFTLPALIAKPVLMVADLNTAISMILIGVLIADIDFEEVKKYLWPIAKFTFVRLIVCGLANIFVLFVIYKIFGGYQNLQMLLFVVLICTMCPAGTSIPGLACVFNKNASYASLLISITSLFCIVSLPSLVALAEFVFRL